VLFDGPSALPDAFVVRDVSPALPDAPLLGDVSPVLLDALVLGDVSPALPDVPALGDVSPASPDVRVLSDGFPGSRDGSRDLPSTLPDALRDVSPSEPDVSVALDGSPGLPDASTEVQSPSPDDSLSAFCSGEFSRMVVNGIESYPAVSGGVIGYNCCEGGKLQALTETILWSITVQWQNATFVLPATLDLANLSPGWRVDVLVGCPPLPALCLSPPDSYFSGLTGTLQVSGTIGGYDMSLCLSLAESPDSPHPLVHSLDLYVPNVHAGY
jgi:hypothetical protein